MEGKVISITAINKNMENLKYALANNISPKLLLDGHIARDSELATLPKTKESDNNNKPDVLCNNNVDCGVKKSSNIDGSTSEVAAPRSAIQQFFHGKNVFITGATGFLGKALIEKLLRSCPGIENIYLLVRQKKGKDIYTRIDEVFEDPVFSRLKEDVPKFRHKIVVIPGDCESVGLGLTLIDRQTLADKVNIIFHAAATVKFDEHLRAALSTNVHAPLHLLRLARDMRQLDVLMHISTAYSNSHLARVEETFYPCAVDCGQLTKLVDRLSDVEIDELLPSILGRWPNTYTFTKALAEKELRMNAGTVPIGVFRPAIVTSTAKEPIKCWIDNMYGPTGVVAGTVTGVLHTLQCDMDQSAEIVPVDLVVNCLIVSAWSVHNEYRQRSSPIEPPVFNYVSSVQNRITWRKFMEYNLKYVGQYPLSTAIWYPSLMLNKHAVLNSIYMVFLHTIPAVLLDGLTACIGQKPKLLKVYRKIHKFSSVISYFTTHSITFTNERTQQLWRDTSTADKEIFPFSISRLNWEKYFTNYLRGIRMHIFKESEDNLPQARNKWRRLFFIHQTVRLVFFCLLLYFACCLCSRMFL